MLYLVNNIKMDIDNINHIDCDGRGRNLSDSDQTKKLIAKEMGINRSAIRSYSVYKRSIDARSTQSRNSSRAVKLVYSFVVECDCADSSVSPACKRLDETTYANFVANRSIEVFKENYVKGTVAGNKVSPSRKIHGRPVIVGAGPAGLFCAYFLAVCGMQPLVIERGAKVEQRIADVQTFFEGGKLNTESNVQFGEGGAGTFSDGKLTTRINDVRCNSVLEIFVANGAPDEIKYQAMPHIGTDRLREVIPNIRKNIEKLGGEFLFDTAVVDVDEAYGRVTAKARGGAGCVEIKTNCVVLAIGHSARDTFEMLFNRQYAMEQKAFSVGTRIEHRQAFMDEAQYGDYAGHPLLGPAVYKLFTKGEDRTAYTFCMCPGGRVVAAASEEGMSVVNGMSEYSRNGENCNSALVVAVGKEDFEGSHPLAGMRFQQNIERKAYDAACEAYRAGGDFSGKSFIRGKGTWAIAPAQTVGAFVEGRASTDSELSKNHVQPSYPGRAVPADLHSILPKFVTGKIEHALKLFDRKINGFAQKSALLTGVETRTSSPVRILRNDNMEAIGKEGVFLAGEGPGYAGGIMSAAVDGIRVAEQILLTYELK